MLRQMLSARIRGALIGSRFSGMFRTSPAVLGRPDTKCKKNLISDRADHCANQDPQQTKDEEVSNEIPDDQQVRAEEQDPQELHEPIDRTDEKVLDHVTRSFYEPQEPLSQELVAIGAPRVQKQYVDTHGIYSQVRECEFSQPQAQALSSTMKEMVQHHVSPILMDCVSKRDVENSKLQLEAMAAELAHEIRLSRQAVCKNYNRVLSQSQTEYELLKQYFNEMISSYKSQQALDMNDRRNAVRSDENDRDAAIKELEDRLSLQMTADSRADMEGMRWYVVRQGLFTALMVSVVALWQSGVQRRAQIRKAREEAILKAARGKFYADDPDANEVPFDGVYVVERLFFPDT